MGSCDSARTSARIAAGGSHASFSCHLLAQRLTRPTTTPSPPTPHHRRVRTGRMLICCVILLSQCSQNTLPTYSRGLGAFPCRPHKGCVRCLNPLPTLNAWSCSFGLALFHPS